MSEMASHEAKRIEIWDLGVVANMYIRVHLTF